MLFERDYGLTAGSTEFRLPCRTMQVISGFGPDLEKTGCELSRDNVLI
jgi:hypothetical protein